LILQAAAPNKPLGTCTIPLPVQVTNIDMY